SVFFFSIPFILISSFYTFICWKNNYTYFFFIESIFLFISLSIIFIDKNYLSIVILFFLSMIPVIPVPFLLKVHVKDIIDPAAAELLKRNIKFMGIAIYIMISMVLLIFTILVIHRKNFEKKSKAKKILMEKYSEVINNYLYENLDIAETTKKLGHINYPVFLMTVDRILDLIKGEFENKIIELSKNAGVYKFLINESKNKKWWKKVKSVYHLGRLKYEEGINNGFYEEILKSNSEDVKIAAIVALSYIDNEKSIYMISKMLFDTSSTVREKAKESIIKFGKKSYQIIIKLLENEKKPDKIALLLNLMSHIKDDNFISKIDFYLNHYDKKIIGAAIDIAASLEYPVDYPLLSNLLQSNDIYLLKTILKNIPYIADFKIIDLIKNNLEHKDWDIRYFTASSLYKLGDKGKDMLNFMINNSKDKYAVEMAKMVIDELR
ncbi:HEAT repeat domain-containing protein, partial [Candidatus Dependentiae bacterium]|nr:HEAT repeat domain-containing protein [Candidatus Dependentiae bacterium]